MNVSERESTRVEQMKATNELVEEHRVIKRVLKALELAVNRLESGEPVRPEVFLSAVDFIRGYADGVHHRKEEGVLFVRMEARGLPNDGCPLGVMLAEHALARQYTRALHLAAQDMQLEIPGAKDRAIQSSRGYIALLREHIRKEDTILFPIADAVIPVEQHSQVWEDFTRAEIEEGAQVKYLALAEALEQQIPA
jgi:hemerythrin-like domain-containing protein